MNRHDFITSLAQTTNRQNYLELGLYDCFNFAQVSAVVSSADGVDTQPRLGIPLPDHCVIHAMSTDEFFEVNTKMFDLIFIDADHQYSSMMSDFENSLKFLSKGGIILLHDTDPINETYTAPGYCGDSYKIHNEIDLFYNLTYVTLPMEEAGMTIITRKEDRRVLNF